MQHNHSKHLHSLSYFSGKINTPKRLTSAKKGLLFILIIVLCFLLASCGEKVSFH